MVLECEASIDLFLKKLEGTPLQISRELHYQLHFIPTRSKKVFIVGEIEEVLKVFPDLTILLQKTLAYVDAQHLCE
jgi:hypothetical protein